MDSSEILEHKQKKEADGCRPVGLEITEVKPHGDNIMQLSIIQMKHAQNGLG